MALAKLTHFGAKRRNFRPEKASCTGHGQSCAFRPIYKQCISRTDSFPNIHMDILRDFPKCAA